MLVRVLSWKGCYQGAKLGRVLSGVLSWEECYQGAKLGRVLLRVQCFIFIKHVLNHY